MIDPLDIWSDELAQANARALGMPSDSTLIVIRSERTVDNSEPKFPLNLSQYGTGHWRVLVPYDEVEPQRGFRFQLFGRAVYEPSTPWYWKFPPTPGQPRGLIVDVWWMGVGIGTSMRAMRQYNPAEGEYQRTVQVLSDEWERDAPLIPRAIRALSMQIGKSENQELAELLGAFGKLDPKTRRTRKQLGDLLGLTEEGVDKKCQRAGVGNLGGLKAVFENQYNNYKL